MLILICGAGGMLGSDLLQVLASQGHVVVGLSKQELDITDYASVRTVLDKVRPDVIINAAAYTNVDGCESEPDLAYKVNALGPRNLALAATATGAALVQLSTDYVFGGSGNRPYREYDPVNPASVYGKSKLDGEILVRSLCQRHYIVRTAWLFGRQGKNFVSTMLRLAQEQPVLKVVNDQVGSPTYTWDLAQAIASLIAKPTYGTYHLTNSGTCSWYEFTQEILRQAGLAPVKLEPITTEELGRPAQRPKFSVLDNYIWRLDGYAPLRSYQEALADYLGYLKAEEEAK